MSLDPKENRRERETDKARKRAEAPPLNAPFPHNRQSFDPFHFALERETLVTPQTDEAQQVITHVQGY